MFGYINRNDYENYKNVFVNCSLSKIKEIKTKNSEIFKAAALSVLDSVGKTYLQNQRADSKIEYAKLINKFYQLFPDSPEDLERISHLSRVELNQILKNETADGLSASEDFASKDDHPSNSDFDETTSGTSLESSIGCEGFLRVDEANPFEPSEATTDSEYSSDSAISSSSTTTSEVLSEASVRRKKFGVEEQKGVEAIQQSVTDSLLEEVGSQYPRLIADLTRLSKGVVNCENLDPPALAQKILAFLSDEGQSDPTIATRAHHILHELALCEMAHGNIGEGFQIQSLAAANIRLSDHHPLYQMDSAIADCSERQLHQLRGANFSHLGSSTLKGGHLHATRRVMDGELLNCFDLKLTHYARDELSISLNAIVNHLDQFEKRLPADFCNKVTVDYWMDFFPGYDPKSDSYSIDTSWTPNNAFAVAITFENVGKVIIGINDQCGSLYNRIKVEMAPDLPPGEGAEKLHKMLSLIGAGPIMGIQPEETNQRIKIAQLCRAYCPQLISSIDRTKKFHLMSLDELKNYFIERDPQMAQIFRTHLDDPSHLMEEIEILPGKFVWGVKDLGEKIKQAGGWGLMRGVPESVPEAEMNHIAHVMRYGLASLEQRYTSGEMRGGSIPYMDFLQNSADQVFWRMITKNNAHIKIGDIHLKGAAQLLCNINPVAEKVPYAHNGIFHGVRHATSVDFIQYKNRDNLITFAANKNIRSDNEVMTKDIVHPSALAGIVVKNTEWKQKLIQHLIALRIPEQREDGNWYFNGVKIEDFVVVADRFEKEMWQ